MLQPIRRPVVCLALLLAASVARGGQYNAVVDLGAPLPAFTALPATDGSKLASTDLTEQVIVLVFLANHCPWVKGMDRDVVAFTEEMKGKDVRVVGVSVNRREDDRLPAMQEHAAKAGYNFTYVYDESQEIGRALGATRTPEFFVFDGSRKLVYMGLVHDSPAQMRQDGSIHYTEGDPATFYLRDAVAATLEGKPVPVAETRAHGCSVEYAAQ